MEFSFNMLYVAVGRGKLIIIGIAIDLTPSQHTTAMNCDHVDECVVREMADIGGFSMSGSMVLYVYGRFGRCYSHCYEFRLRKRMCSATVR